MKKFHLQVHYFPFLFYPERLEINRQHHFHSYLTKMFVCFNIKLLNSCPSQEENRRLLNAFISRSSLNGSLRITRAVYAIKGIFHNCIFNQIRESAADTTKPSREVHCCEFVSLELPLVSQPALALRYMVSII